jgi:hypothetical protein
MVPEINNCEQLVAQIDQLGVAQTVKLHRKPPLPTRILRDLHALYHDQDLYLSFLAHYPLIPSDLADQIASDLDPEKTDIAVGLAGNPRCPQQALHRLAQHPEIAVRHALAANPNLTPKEFQGMVDDASPFVRAQIAQNISLPLPLQFILANDASSAVKITLAGRKNLDLDIAVHLAESDDAAVRAALILNYSLDEELLQLWADNDDIRQQLLLLKRKKAPPRSAIDSLTYSPHSYVRRSALVERELSGPEMLFLAESDDIRDRTFLAEKNSLPASIQRMLAQDPSAKVRKRLAANGTINESIALHIAASSDLGACRVLAKNPAITDTVIAELCVHPEDDIAQLIAYRDDLDHSHYDRLINQRSSLVVAQHLAYLEIQYYDCSQPVAEALARHAAPTIRAFVAGSPQLSHASRDRLLSDPSDPVRLALANNPALSPAQLEILDTDSNREVVLAADKTAARLRRRSNELTNDSRPLPQFDAAESLHDAPPIKPARKTVLFNKIVNFFAE